MGKYFKSGSLVAMAATAILMSSCAKEFELYDPVKDATAKYEKNWKETFGNIDPNQDWNMATQKTVTVTVPATSEVNIYTKGLEKSYLLANTSVTGTADIKFDVRKGLAEVYVVAISGDSRNVRTVDITGETATADFNSSQARAAMTRAGETLPEREFVYAVGYNLVEGQMINSFNSDIYNLINYNCDKEHNYSSWGSNIYASGKWSTGNYDQTAPETGTDVNMSSLADVQTGCAELYTRTDDDITKLYPFTQDYKMVTAKAQEITLTGIFRNTSGNTALLYYYTTPGASVNDLKAADKYILIPNTENIVGKEYKLIYYDPNNNYAPTYTFPSDVEIHFALAINPACGTKWVEYNATDGDIRANVMNAGLLSFSDEALNTDMFRDIRLGQKSSAWTSMASSAIYTYNGTNIISFEDWGGNFSVNNGVPSASGTNSIDWNDLAFAINADFQTPPPPVEEEQKKGESWIIACEDLGSTDDYDFNDIVFKVSHVAGQNIATVTPLAAGGVYESHILFNNVALGETHQMLGAKATEGNYPMINTSSITATGTSQTVTVPTDFSLANSMGGFGITVKTNDNINAVIITAPDAGEAPQMFCVPGTWAWPTERTKIQEAYPNFADWNGNSSNADWYKTPVAGKVLGGE